MVGKVCDHGIKVGLDISFYLLIPVVALVVRRDYRTNGKGVWLNKATNLLKTCFVLRIAKKHIGCGKAGKVECLVHRRAGYHASLRHHLRHMMHRYALTH